MNRFVESKFFFLILCLVSIVLMGLALFGDSGSGVNPCQNYADIPMKDVPAKCVGYWM